MHLLSGKPCHWISFNLICNSFFKKISHFLQRLPLYLLKVTKHLFLHYTFCSHVLSFWDLFLPCLCLLSPSCRQHPAPQGTVLTELQERTPLQSSLWRTSYKSLRYCCVWGRWGCGYLSKDCIPTLTSLCTWAASSSSVLYMENTNSSR